MQNRLEENYDVGKDQKEKIILDRIEAKTDQKSNKSLSQCLIEAYNLTQHRDLIGYIAKRDDVLQSREFEDLPNGECYITYTFKAESGDSLCGLTKEEKEVLKGKDIIDTLFYLYEITNSFDVLKMLSQRKEIFQTREYKDVNNECFITYKFQRK